MRKAVTRGLLIAALFVLTACFASDGPLFSTSQAAYPLGTVTRYVHYDHGETGAAHDWKKSYSGTITLGDDRTYTDTHNDGKNDIATIFTLYAIGDGYYIVADLSDAGTSGEIYYDLLKLEGKTAYLFGLDCVDIDEATLKSNGIGAPDEDGFCTATSLDGLVATFKAMRADAPAPSEKYELGG